MNAAATSQTVVLAKPDSAQLMVWPAALKPGLASFRRSRRAGLISPDQAAREAAMLQAMLRARDQAELERKLDALQATLEVRGGPGRSSGHG